MQELGLGSQVPPRFRHLRRWRRQLCLFLHEIKSMWDLGAMVVLQVSREEAERDRGMVDGNLLLCHRSTIASTSSGSGLASVLRWRGWVSEREQGWGKWASPESSRGGLKLIFKSYRLSLGWFASNMIGRRGRCFWTALCSECRGGGVGGWLAWSLIVRFQRHCGQFGVWRGRLRCTTGLGKGGIVMASPCYASVRGEQSDTSSTYL
jgi:hypothetical protein